MRVTEWSEGEVAMESVALVSEGEPVGEARTFRGSWTELRDHARFPAERCRREEDTRTAPIGEYEGWLYTVDNPEQGAVTRFFFPHDLPAPRCGWRSLAMASR